MDPHIKDYIHQTAEKRRLEDGGTPLNIESETYRLEDSFEKIGEGKLIIPIGYEYTYE